MNPPDKRTWNRYFLALLLLNTLLFAFLVLDHRMVRGHDSWQYYSTQYFFAANAAQGGGVAWWMPYMTQGTASNWHEAWQGGMFQHVLLAVGPLVKGMNFLPLFTLGLFLDELLFLVGVWCLARKFYRLPSTVFFVSCAAVGSCLWADQIWYNFHSYYAVPLLLSWVHDVLDGGARWKLYLAADLFLFQTLGNLPYLPVLTALVLLIYGGVLLAVDRRRLGALRPRTSDLLGLALLAASGVVLYLTLQSGADLNVVQTRQRTPEGTTRLDDFLVYAGYTNPVRYLEFVHGISPCLDYTLFCGFLTPAFAALAFVYRPDRRTLHLAAVLLLILLFSCGFLELMAPTAYYLMPGMRYFRHVSLIAPFVKLFLIFLSGFGFERATLLFREQPRAAVPLGGILLVLGAILGVVGLSSRESLYSVLSMLKTATLEMPANPDLTRSSFLARSLLAAALVSALSGLFLLAAGRAGARPAYWTALLAFHAVQLFAWKFEMLHLKTFRLNPEQMAMQELRPIPYVPRRSEDYASNPRYAAFQKDLFRREHETYGTLYWTSDSYLFFDAPASRFRTTDWMIPLDELMRAYAGQPIGDRRAPLSTWAGWILGFPKQHPAAAKVIGLDRDKLQVFSNAHRPGTSEQIASYLTAPDYRGDLLFLHGGEKYFAIPSISANERLDAPCQVLEFDANHLRVKTTVPHKAWLLYCDVWHPGWTAEVNGKAVPVERAQIAYKAVALEEGENVVEFRFRAPVRAICFAANAIHAAFWILLVLGMIVKLFQEKPLQATTPCYN